MVSKLMRALVAYLTRSGNTQEVAEIASGVLRSNGYEVDEYRIGVNQPLPDVPSYDLILFGTYTIGKGQVPVKMKKFVAEVGYKPERVYLFGTGDTQFGGDDLFCHAATKLAKFYKADFRTLKIEQSPRGKQEKRVQEWTEGIIKHEEINESKSVGTGKSK